MELPPIGELRHLLDRLKSNDIAWFRESFKSGKFAWLKDHLPGDGYETLGKKIEAGDLGYVKSALGGLKLPGVDLFSGLGAGAVAGVAGAAGAAAGVAGAAAGALKGGAGAATGALKGGVGAASGAVKGGAGALKGAAVSANDDRKKKGAMWLIPAAIIAAVLLGLGLTRCNKDDKAADTSAETTVVASDSTVAAAATDTTVAAATETSAAAAPAAASVVDVAFGDSQFSKLSAAIGAAGLTDTLKGAGPFTVLAPTDTAFNNLPAGVLDKLLLPANKDALAKILSFHVIPGKVMSGDIVTGPVKSVEGTDLNFTSADGKVSVNGANVITPDVAAGNGVVHAIDAVLVPASVDLNALVADGAAAPAAAGAAGDIVAVAAANGSFGTLVKAVEAAGLVDTLKGPGPFTVFAPTDEAFAKVDPAVLAKLLLPENKAALAKVLTYHVVAGKVMAADVKTGEVATVEGSKAALVADAGKVTIDGANVVTPDVAASNGVIHVIDAVILPKDLDLASLTQGDAPAAVVNAAGDATPEDLTVYFDTASAAINGEGQAKIVAASRILQELPAGTKVNVVGHADNRGNAAKNQALSEARAAAVVQALKGGLGDKASNIEFASSAKGDTEQAADLAKSRRVTIEIQK
jgi:transforming growth factor-beta-induced protein